MADTNTSAAQETSVSTETTETVSANTNSEVNVNSSQSAQNDSQKDAPQTNVEKLIQTAVDRATNRLGNDNKKLREQIEALKKEKLTDDEIKQLEMKEREADLADREAKIKEQENRLFAIKAIKEAGLDDGSSKALTLVDFVMTDNEETTTARVKAFSDLVKKFVAAQVDQTFKSNGRNPEKGGSGESNATNNIAVTIGKTAANRDAAATNVLNQYLGGK